MHVSPLLIVMYKWSVYSNWSRCFPLISINDDDDSNENSSGTTRDNISNPISTTTHSNRYPYTDIDVNDDQTINPGDSDNDDDDILFSTYYYYYYHSLFLLLLIYDGNDDGNDGMIMKEEREWTAITIICQI